jgi:hypothetical protein
LEGIEIFEPFSLLQKRTHKSIVKELVHPGGLRASIINGGKMNIGNQLNT